VSELGPNALGEWCDPGRVADCYLALERYDMRSSYLGVL
jgi:hypothetical protein